MVSVPRVLRRRPRLNIIAFTATVLVTVGALEAADLWWRRDQALEQAQLRARNLSLVLAAYVHGSFASADAALRQMALHNVRVGGPSAPHDAWDPILASARSALPEIGSFSVTDRHGTITHSTVKTIVGASRRDDYLFQQLAARDTTQLVVDRPFLSVTAPQQYLIPIGRRLVDAEGRFDGAAVASMRPESYREFFRTLDLGSGGTITIRDADGLVLFRAPAAAVSPAGAAEITADRSVVSPPLVVSISLPRRDVLADWYRQRRVAAGAYGALALTLSIIVLLLFRVVSARERAERELAAVQRQEAERLRVSNQRLADALDREQAARRAVEEASHMKDEFLMTVSHELRTPLTAIYGWVRVLATREVPRADQAKALGAIERNALAQTRLIDDLLDVSRAISGKLRLEPRPVDIGAVVRAAVETLTPAMAARRLHLDLSIEPDLEAVPADPDRLQQIVWNLLSNATKFTPAGGRIEVQARRAADTLVEIVVADNGAGIRPEFLPHVFDRFRQGDAGTRRRFGGLGLGLAIVRHLVELHGGTVDVQSEGEGMGATFRVRLPAREGQPIADPAARARDAAGSPPPRLDGVRVLVVDDQGDARELFEQILEAAGARVEAVSSAGEALARLTAEPFDVLVSDIEMAAMDGYELIRLVRAATRVEHNRVAAVALTAYARNADRRRALDAGFDEHVAKPVDPVTLVSTIASLLPVT